MPRFLGLAILIVAVGCARNLTQTPILPATGNDAASRARAAGPPTSPIRHVIIIVQENRTVDNLFNGLPGAATVKLGLGANNRIVPLHAVDLAVPYDPDHSHAGFLTEYAGGAINGFQQEHFRCSCSPPPDAAYAYVPRDQVQPYWTMAQEYAFADEMFQTNEGPSFPAHQYLISGTSAISRAGSLSAMDNPGGDESYRLGGCDSPAGTVVRLIDLETDDQTHTTAPCFDHETLMDTLDAAGVSWRYYEADPGAGLWNAPDAIRHLRYGPDFADVIVPSKRIITDIQGGSLADVNWVTPTADESDHAGISSDAGPAWVASIVNAVGESRDWTDTAIFVVWDDWGGWYDHAAPRQFNYYELGFRVPLIAISPYARPGYVSHVQHEFGSLLKFVENTYGLPSLGYTDLRADDLGDMFDYDQVPRTFRPIPSPTVPPKVADDRRNPDDDF